jgi:hypothetical protein
MMTGNRQCLIFAPNEHHLTALQLFLREQHLARTSSKPTSVGRLYPI